MLQWILIFSQVNFIFMLFYSPNLIYLLLSVCYFSLLSSAFTIFIPPHPGLSTALRSCCESVSRETFQLTGSANGSESDEIDCGLVHGQRMRESELNYWVPCQPRAIWVFLLPFLIRLSNNYII